MDILAYEQMGMKQGLSGTCIINVDVKPFLHMDMEKNISCPLSGKWQTENLRTVRCVVITS